jgi:chromosome segregation ATPase
MMFRRIFGIGRKKQPSAAHSGTSDVLTQSHDSETDTDGSVVPLRSGAMAARKKDNAEVFQEAVDKLVEKLEHINDNLSSQVSQNKRLVERMDALPGMLSPLPKAVEEQRAAFSQVAEQLKAKVARDEKVAEELCGIHEKVAASAQVDAKLCETFGTFSDTLGRLDEDTISQTEWIQRMSRTFSAGEQYLKQVLAKQQARFYWVFGISLGVCFLAIVTLIIGIAMLRGGM